MHVVDQTCLFDLLVSKLVEYRHKPCECIVLVPVINIWNQLLGFSAFLHVIVIAGSKRLKTGS